MTMLVAAATMLTRTVTAALPGQGHVLLLHRKSPIAQLGAVLGREFMYLEVRFPDTVESQPELLAYHFTEADLRQQAVRYWLQAGQRAGEHSAYAEAISHLTRGLELVSTLPDMPERAERELVLQTTLAASLEATKGWAAPEVGQAHARAPALCQHIGVFPRLQ